MDCNTCKEKRKQADPVSLAAFESMKATLERTITRLWIALILVIVLFVGSNAAWIWYESQWVDETTETVESFTEGGGDAYGTIVSGDRSIVSYGESQSNAD